MVTLGAHPQNICVQTTSVEVEVEDVFVFSLPLKQLAESSGGEWDTSVSHPRKKYPCTITPN